MTNDRGARWLAAALGGAALLLLFQFFGNPVRGYIDTASLFYWWGFQCVNPASEGEHGWLILGLSAWLLWRNLKSVEGSGWRSESSVPAFAAIVAGLALHALGFAAQQTRISIVAFLVCLWGALRLGGGRRWGAAAAFPVAFLVFAIPVALLDTIGFWLRLAVVNASTAIAHRAHIDVLRSGTQLVSPDGTYHYDVAAACSGVRSLTAMVALSLLVGYLNFHSWRRRALVLLACFPLVYLGNVARIVAIIFAAQLGGAKWGHVAHDVMGYGIFAIVLGGVLLVANVMARRWPEGAEDGGRRAEDGEIEGRAGWWASPAVVAGAVVVLAVGEMFFLRHVAALPPRGEPGVRLAADGLNPVELPAFLGTEWIGQSAPISAVEREILPADTGFSRRNYALLSDRRRDVFLSIVLSGRDRSSIHRPELCLVGQGWTIRDTTRQTFRFPGRDDAAFEATLLRVEREITAPPRAPGAAAEAPRKEAIPQLVAYWFVGGDRVVATNGQRMLVDAWNRVAHARADRWAYVLLQTDARDGEAAALARMQAVLDTTLPSFQRPLGRP